MIELFKNYMIEEDKSLNTINSYVNHIENYFKWFEQSFGLKFKVLYRENVLDYKSYLMNIRKLNAKSINAKIAALIKLNQFLVKDFFRIIL